VNGRLVRLEEFERALTALAADHRHPVGESEKQHVLDRLVEEELLVQRALELGLERHDRRVRGDLVSAVVRSVVSEAMDDVPTPAEVEAFYLDNRDYFTRPGRLRTRHVMVEAGASRPPDQALARAEEAARRLRAAEAFAVVQDELGDEEVASLPDGFLTPVKLREYLGPTAVRAALALAVGDVSDPVRGATGYHVLQVLEREPRRTPPLTEIETEVRAELRRRAEDQALRAYLGELRERAEVRTASRLP
jgi:hypothetical protein